MAMRSSGRASTAALLSMAAAGAIAWSTAALGQDDIAYSQRGEASWYGPGFDGEETASGSIFDPSDLTAAHRNLPLGAEVTVTNRENGKRVEVTITDRGPYVADRVIDLSTAAAKQLGMVKDGTTPVRIEATTEQLEQAGSRAQSR